MRCTKIECGLFAGKVLNKRRIIGILKAFVTYNFDITRTGQEKLLMMMITIVGMIIMVENFDNFDDNDDKNY